MCISSWKIRDSSYDMQSNSAIQKRRKEDIKYS
uniref:Uncharacterized protein n=1 Tax=Arundo donax TaxID=35708 RepID=A0A0A8Z7I7_ARUDO